MRTHLPLDFQPSTHDLNDILFDVTRMRLTTYDEDIFKSELNGIPVKSYYALINHKNKDVLCVVSSNYELFTNKQALEFGKQAFVDLFPSVKKEDLIPYKVISSLRKTYCHIDLIHKDVNFTVWEQETWYPFVRITNSYNRKYKFSLELGFVRKLCSNGVIFEKKTIKVNYSHSKGEIPISVSADIKKLKELEREFKSYLLNLKRFHVDRKLVLSLVCKALKLNHETAFNNKNYNIEILKNRTFELADIYMQAHGETAFAVMNVITDLVSHQDEYEALPHYSFLANEYYRRVSFWMSEFCDKAEKRDFNMETYLGAYLRFKEN